MNEWIAYRDANRRNLDDKAEQNRADFRLQDDQLAAAREKWDEFYNALCKACQYGVADDRATKKQRSGLLHDEFAKSSRSS